MATLVDKWLQKYWPMCRLSVHSEALEQEKENHLALVAPDWVV